MLEDYVIYQTKEVLRSVLWQSNRDISYTGTVHPSIEGSRCVVQQKICHTAATEIKLCCSKKLPECSIEAMQATFLSLHSPDNRVQ